MGMTTECDLRSNVDAYTHPEFLSHLEADIRAAETLEITPITTVDALDRYTTAVYDLQEVLSEIYGYEHPIAAVEKRIEHLGETVERCLRLAEQAYSSESVLDSARTVVAQTYHRETGRNVGYVSDEVLVRTPPFIGDDFALAILFKGSYIDQEQFVVRLPRWVVELRRVQLRLTNDAFASEWEFFEGPVPAPSSPVETELVLRFAQTMHLTEAARAACCLCTAEI